VLVSPLQRARETCELASVATSAIVEPDLVEWNYGTYEGLTPGQIHEHAPGWLIFRDGCPDGETPEQVSARADRVIARARAVAGDVALFAHGHVVRVLVARWLGLPAGAGQHFLLDTGTLNVLDRYRGNPGTEDLEFAARRLRVAKRSTKIRSRSRGEDVMSSGGRTAGARTLSAAETKKLLEPSVRSDPVQRNG